MDDQFNAHAPPWRWKCCGIWRQLILVLKPRPVSPDRFIAFAAGCAVANGAGVVLLSYFLLVLSIVLSRLVPVWVVGVQGVLVILTLSGLYIMTSNFAFISTHEFPNWENIHVFIFLVSISSVGFMCITFTVINWWSIYLFFPFTWLKMLYKCRMSATCFSK